MFIKMFHLTKKKKIKGPRSFCVTLSHLMILCRTTEQCMCFYYKIIPRKPSFNGLRGVNVVGP